MGEHASSALLRFAHLVAEAGAAGEMLLALAEAAGTFADAAIVLQVVEGGTVRVVSTRGITQDLTGWTADADAIGAELAREIRDLLGGEFAEAQAQPMVSSGGLFGALVLLYREAHAVDPERFEFAAALVDLTATAMSKAAQFEELSRAHAELRASQEALLRTEKLRALGQMAAGITHDFKNILNPLWLHVQFLEKDAIRGDPKSVAEAVTEMKQVLRRGIETVERLRLFSRQSPEAKPEIVDLNRLAREAVDIARPRMSSSGGRLSVMREELGAPPPISARAGEVVSALVNLIVNAIDAMPNGGAITVRTREERQGAQIEIVDNGPGMPPEVERRVFEPFFTTKGEQGTGLGLAMVYACVQRHGGSIALKTAPGEGTTFTLWFPRAPGV